MNTILSIINKFDNSATSKAILYRQGWVGKLLQSWLDKKGIKTNISEMMINDIIRQVKRHFKGSAAEKLKERAANQKSALKAEKEGLENNLTDPGFFSLASFLASCRISENSIFQLAEIVKKIDENSPPNQPLTRDQINEFVFRLEEIKNHPGIILSTIHGMKGLEADYVFLIFCDQKVLPKKEKFSSDWEKREEENLFFTAITRPKIGLYITTSSEKECSPFITLTNLNLDLVELIKKF